MKYMTSREKDQSEGGGRVVDFNNHIFFGTFLKNSSILVASSVPKYGIFRTNIMIYMAPSLRWFLLMATFPMNVGDYLAGAVPAL